ncbi:MAG: ABC transporter ATP-binding protein [Phycisphaerae bacterium]|jgi:lipoprotein-releasing system ATP-binding protein
MLQVESIQKRFATRAGELVVLRDVSLELAAGEAAAILGPSGSGKSTLLNIIGALEPPTAGRVRLDGCDPYALSPAALAEFRNRRVGLVFQDHHLLPQCTVLENVLLPMLVHRAGDGVVRRAEALLERVGLSARREHRPAELSGGERQRVAIARALINEPVLLLADEPTGNLDRTTAARIGELLVEVQRERSVVLVVVTHSTTLAERFARCYELDDGRLLPDRAGSQP